MIKPGKVKILVLKDMFPKKKNPNLNLRNELHVN